MWVWEKSWVDERESEGTGGNGRREGSECDRGEVDTTIECEEYM